MRRSALTALLALVTSLLVVLSPGPSGAVQRVVPVDADEVRIALDRVRTVRLDEPAQHLALYWKGSPHARVRVALSSDGDTFGPARGAGRDDVGEQRQDGTTYGAVLAAEGATVVRVATDRPIARLTVLAMRDGAETVSTRRVPGSTAVAATHQPPVTSRGMWGADESLRSGNPSFATVRKLIVHHTATGNGYETAADAAGQVRAILRYHTVTQGWSDIGYNFLIDKFGTVYEGRYSRPYEGAPPTGDDAAGDGVVGAHAKGYNAGSMGVAVLGTHTSGDITPAARDSLERLLAWGAARNGIDPTATEQFTNPVSGVTITTANIGGHRDYGSTECPGGALYATFPALRRAVAARMTEGQADSTAPSRPTGLAASPRRHRVSLTWTASTDDSGVAPRYRVLRARSATGTFRRVATTSSTSHVDTGLRRQRVYHYAVRAVDGAGNVSAASDTVRTRTR